MNEILKTTKSVWWFVSKPLLRKQREAFVFILGTLMPCYNSKHVREQSCRPVSTLHCLQQSNKPLWHLRTNRELHLMRSLTRIYLLSNYTIPYTSVWFCARVGGDWVEQSEHAVGGVRVRDRGILLLSQKILHLCRKTRIKGNVIFVVWTKWCLILNTSWYIKTVVVLLKMVHVKKRNKRSYAKYRTF